MVLDTVRSQFNRLYEQAEYRRAIKLTLVAAVGALWVFSRFVSNVISIEETILVTILLLLFSVEALETDTYRIEELLASQTRALGEHRDLKTQVESLLGENPERLHILGYSGSSALLQSVIGEAIDRGADVYLLYQHPAHTYNEKEEDLTIDAVKYLYRFHKMDDNVEVRFYDEPASVMGLRSDHGITLGWYTYSDYREGLDSADRAVQGPENEALLFPDEDRRQFPVMDNYFTELYTYLWLGGRTLEEVYEADDCPAALRDWVDSGTEADQERRREWFARTASHDAVNRTDLFPDQEPIAGHGRPARPEPSET